MVRLFITLLLILSLLSCDKDKVHKSYKIDVIKNKGILLKKIQLYEKGFPHNLLVIRTTSDIIKEDLGYSNSEPTITIFYLIEEGDTIK